MRVILLIFEAFVDKFGKFDIALTESRTVVRGKGHLEFVVDIEPFRMMVHCFGLKVIRNTD